MNKYQVYLADNYTDSKPFTTSWDYELIGDKLRAEFDEWFKDQEEKAQAGMGKSKQLLKSEYIKKFMISKRINLVDDPSNGNLKSVFILRKGEKKLIDERAKNDLANRFEYKERKDKDGNKLETIGFMKFDLVEGSEEKKKEESETLKVDGNEIQYFEEEEKEEKEEEIEEEKFICENCGKEFSSKKALQGHKLSCKE